MGRYYANGYTTPTGINSKTEVKRIQAALGVKQDGIWGAQTQAAWNAQSQGNISMPKTQAAVSQQVQGRPDYAVSGFTPPSGVTNRQVVRSIQANLGVKQDGVWGSKTQAAWEKQYGDLWQKDAVTQQTSSKGYTPLKGIDGSEEIRQVQQRLHVKVDGIWGKDTQEAWDKMRSSKAAYQTPKGIDSEEEIRQVQQRLHIETSGVWDGKTQEAWNKMRSAQINQAPKGIDSEGGNSQVQPKIGPTVGGTSRKAIQEDWKKKLATQTYQGVSGINRSDESGRILRQPDMTSIGSVNSLAQPELNKPGSNRENNSPIAQRKQQKMQKSLERYSKLVEQREKIESYLSEGLRQQRDPRDNSGIAAMVALSRVLASSGNAKDADHIRAHIAQYNEEAVSGKSNVINYPNKSGSRRYNANDKLVREAFKAGKGIYDGLPPLEDGQVIIDVVDGTPLFALSSDKSYGQKAVEKGIEIVAGNVPYFKYFASAASWAKELQLEGYFEFHPDTILEKGDIVIYYKSPEDERGYGATYAFRGDELLYIDSWGYNDRSVEFGPNYMKYAEQYKKDIITIIADAVFWDVVGGILGDSAKKIYGELKK